MIFANLDLETNLWNLGVNSICGIDEVGRGCFAGPVVAAGVVFPKDTKLPFQVADSKLLTAKARLGLDNQIKEQAVAWTIAEISVEIINQVGIGQATQQAFLKVVQSLEFDPEMVLIDAFWIKGLDRKRQQAVPNGDTICASIAAASVIAKVYRDNLMEQLSLEYPEYQLHQHKGYGTKLHREAIKKYGLSEIHRTSFNLDKFL